MCNHALLTITQQRVQLFTSLSCHNINVENPQVTVMYNVMTVPLTVEEHCVDVTSDHIGRRDASRGGLSVTSAHSGKFGRSYTVTLVVNPSTATS